MIVVVDDVDVERVVARLRLADVLDGLGHGGGFVDRHDVRRHQATGGALAVLEELLRSEEHTSELQSLTNLVCRLLLEKKKNKHHQAKKGEADTDEPEIEMDIELNDDDKSGSTHS